MSLISLEFFQRYQSELDTAIKNYFSSKKEIIDMSIPINAGTALETGVDLNDLQEAGNYYIESDTVAGGLVNLPLALSGKVLVIDNGADGIVQYYIPNHSTRLFQRNYWSSTWTNWVEYGEKSVYISQTLTAGQTSVTFNSADITATALVDVYTSVAGLVYQSMSGSVGSVTVTYEAQASDITVTLEIKKQ